MTRQQLPDDCNFKSQELQIHPLSNPVGIDGALAEEGFPNKHMTTLFKVGLGGPDELSPKLASFEPTDLGSLAQSTPPLKPKQPLYFKAS